jgi:hypothetical protein
MAIEVIDPRLGARNCAVPDRAYSKKSLLRKNPATFLGRTQ